MQILVAGGLGGIASEVVKQLIPKKMGEVVIIDNKSKKLAEDKEFNNLINWMPDIYSQADKANYYYGDFINLGETWQISVEKADVIIFAAAKLGGIRFFHDYIYDMLSENNRMLDNVLSYIKLRKLSPHFIFLSSSMVYENTNIYPTPENALDYSPPPSSTYGFAKLSGERYVKGISEEIGLRYTIVRPFNSCTARELPLRDHVGYAHVINDLIRKIYDGQGTKDNPLEIFGDGSQIRCYTLVEDIADGIITCINNPKAINETFNIATNVSHSVNELTQLIWQHMRGTEKLYIKCVGGFKYDVKKRIPSVEKAKKVLGWTAKRKLEEELPRIINLTVKSLAEQGPIDNGV